MQDFSGKTVLVTGGAGHIGRAICEHFLAAGATAAVYIGTNNDGDRSFTDDGLSAIIKGAADAGDDVSAVRSALAAMLRVSASEYRGRPIRAGLPAGEDERWVQDFRKCRADGAELAEALLGV